MYVYIYIYVYISGQDGGAAGRHGAAHQGTRERLHIAIIINSYYY